MLLTGNDRLCEEVVLLISSAKCKNIDVSVWLTEEGSDGKITAPDFNSKLISLGLIVGMGEDCDKKGKLDYATSDTSLGRIHCLCYGGEDSNGTPYVDVTEFLHLCSKMLTTSINQSILTSRSVYPLADSVEILAIGDSFSWWDSLLMSTYSIFHHFSCKLASYVRVDGCIRFKSCFLSLNVSSFHSDYRQKP